MAQRKYYTVAALLSVKVEIFHIGARGGRVLINFFCKLRCLKVRLLENVFSTEKKEMLPSALKSRDLKSCLDKNVSLCICAFHGLMSCVGIELPPASSLQTAMSSRWSVPQILCLPHSRLLGLSDGAGTSPLAQLRATNTFTHF